MQLGLKRQTRGLILNISPEHSLSTLGVQVRDLFHGWVRKSCQEVILPCPIHTFFLPINRAFDLACMTHMYLIVLCFFYPQLSRMMGLDVIARKREWHLEPCSKNDIKSAQQGLSKLVTFLSPHEEEATEQNQIWSPLTSLVRRTCNVNYKTIIIHSTLLTSSPTIPSAMLITTRQYFKFWFLRNCCVVLRVSLGCLIYGNQWSLFKQSVSQYWSIKLVGVNKLVSVNQYQLVPVKTHSSLTIDCQT